MSKFIDVPEGYRCPLCPDDEDEDFVWSPVLNGPMCLGCSHDVLNLVVDDERPEDRTLDRLEEATGLSYPEYQILELENQIRAISESLPNMKEEDRGEWESYIEIYERLVLNAQRKLLVSR